VLYLLDANVLITAHNQYYPINRIPEFWGWLRHMGERGIVKVPLEIYEEVLEGSREEEKDLLLAWCRTTRIRRPCYLARTSIRASSAKSSRRDTLTI
jgi:DNA helicase HerA-like ATPase